MNYQNIREDVLINNRAVSQQQEISYLEVKVGGIFTYEGLPLTMPKRNLEKLVTLNGYAVVYEFEDELFATSTRPSEMPNVYGENTKLSFTHINSGRNVYLTRIIGVDAVLVRNDSGSLGLSPIIEQFATLIAQQKMTWLDVLVDLRTKYIIQAKDENAKRSAEAYVDAIRGGQKGILYAEEFSEMEGVVVHQVPQSGDVATQTIEISQYIFAHYYSEFGITLNNNMKSQYVSDSEMGKSTGMPLIADMLECRLEAARDIKALFGVDITVSLSEEYNDEQEQDAESNDETIPGADGEVEGAEATDGPVEADPEAEAEAGVDSEDNPEEDGTEEAGAEEVEEPSVAPVTEAELVEATEALTGEELSNDQEDDTDPAADDAGTEGDADEDESSGDGVAPEGDDDEEGKRPVDSQPGLQPSDTYN